MARVATATQGTRATEAERSSKESARFVVAMRVFAATGASRVNREAICVGMPKQPRIVTVDELAV